MRITIVGAGAIGGTVGAFLARAGREVELVDADAAHVQAMREKGLTITGAADFTVPVAAMTPSELDGSLETVLLCVKALHTREALTPLAPLLAPDGVVVSLQNGLEEPVIAEIVGPQRTIGCYINFMADYLEPGRVMYGGPGAFDLGELDGRETPRLRELKEMLGAALPMPVTITDNLLGHLWGKMAVAAMLFATSLADVDVADLYDVPRYRRLCADLAAEALAVARAEGIACLGSDGFDPAVFCDGAEAKEAALADCYRGIQSYWRGSLKVRSGIWRDLAIRHRRTEVDVQLTPLIKRGQRHGLESPRLKALVAMVHEAEQGTRARSTENLDELASFSEQQTRPWSL